MTPAGGVRGGGRAPKGAAGAPHARVEHGRITEAEAWKLHDAWTFAIHMGWPPSLFVTINWTLAPSSTYPDTVRRLSLIRDRFKSFLRRNGVADLVWIEVRENPGGHAEHVHWAIFVPFQLEARFKAGMRDWVAMDADTFDRRAVVSKRIWNWIGLQRYFLKAGSTEVRRLFWIRGDWMPFQGQIDGPRVRVAHAIGDKARKDSGWLVAPLEPAAAHG